MEAGNGIFQPEHNYYVTQCFVHVISIIGDITRVTKASYSLAVRFFLPLAGIRLYFRFMFLILPSMHGHTVPKDNLNLRIKRKDRMQRYMSGFCTRHTEC